MTACPHLLLTNDDGIFAPGLRHLYEALKGLCRITILAPATDQSGSGVSVSMRTPLHLEKVHWGDGTPAYSLSGTPADCVKIALSALMDSLPDFVFSGINRGSNAGRNIFYSGTVGAAIESAINQVGGVALSCCDPLNLNYEVAASYAPKILELLMTDPLPPGTLLNVNVPPGRAEEMRGLRLATQGRSYWKEVPDRRLHPDGFPYYWLGGQHALFDEEATSDIILLQEGYVTAVPITIHSLTDTLYFSRFQKAFEALSPEREDQNACLTGEVAQLESLPR